MPIEYVPSPEKAAFSKPPPKPIPEKNEYTPSRAALALLCPPDAVYSKMLLF